MAEHHAKPFSAKEFFLSLISAAMKGISQVIFIENVISGVIILVAIAISSWYLGLIALLSSAIGALVGKIGGGDEETVNRGLYGYNSVLTGMALILFLTEESRWAIALAAAAITAIFTAAMMHFMKNTTIPIVTFPFIVLTWFMLIASYKLETIQLSNDLVPQSLSQWELHIEGKVDWTKGIFNGIGQIFFLNHVISGILLFIAVFWAGWRWILYAVLGNGVALIAAYGLGGEHSLIYMGLYGYNAILACLAVALVFKEEHNHYAPVSGIIAACLTVPLTASMSTWLLPYGLPALTMPFVLATWLFLGARKILPRF